MYGNVWSLVAGVTSTVPDDMSQRLTGVAAAAVVRCHGVVAPLPLSLLCTASDVCIGACRASLVCGIARRASLCVCVYVYVCVCACVVDPVGVAVGECDWLLLFTKYIHTK